VGKGEIFWIFWELMAPEGLLYEDVDSVFPNLTHVKPSDGRITDVLINIWIYEPTPFPCIHDLTIKGNTSFWGIYGLTSLQTSP